MHITTLISAAITLLGVLVVMRWMPGRAAGVRAAPAAVPAPAAAPAREAAPASDAALNGNAVLNGQTVPVGEAAAESSGVPGGPLTVER
jgi:hypothetical protein